MSRRLLLVPVGLLVLGACGDAGRDDAVRDDGRRDDAVRAETASSDVEHAVAVRRGIEAAPDAADSVLAAHGLTEAGLDSLMYRIASDSAAAAEYRRLTR